MKHTQPQTQRPSTPECPATGRTSTCPRPPSLGRSRTSPIANGYSVAREYVDEAESGRVVHRP